MTRSATFPTVRLRRLRQHPRLRDLVRETELTVNDLMQPLFVIDGEGVHNEVSSMPGVFQLSVDKLDDEIHHLVDLGIPSVLLFGLPAKKDERGSDALHDQGVVQKAIRKIKAIAPDILITADLCMCEYTDHGHCGIVSETPAGELDVNNDFTLPLLAEQAVSLALAGADVIAPSGMIDGMVDVIREALDDADFQHVSILSYAVKYASGLYGPFREAADGAPTFGDRRTYQMDPANAARALREAEQDVLEGADMLMVKPASLYLDVIYRVKQQYPGIPLGAYHVSGEFAMIKAAAEKGWVDESRVVLETLMAIKRAGADFIITYFAKDAALLLQS